MAGMVCEKDALPLRRQAVAPGHLHAADQPRTAGDDARKRTQIQHRFTAAKMLAVRRISVTTEPSTITPSANATICPRQPSSGSTTDSAHAAVITAMRCGFAIGPMKECPAPIEAPR